MASPGGRRLRKRASGSGGITGIRGAMPLAGGVPATADRTVPGVPGQTCPPGAPASSARKPSASRTGTPSSWAFASLLPAPGPATR